MVKVNEIHSTATFAWSSESVPVLATGTAAGVIDDSFSSSSSLDFYKLYENKPFVSVEAEAKFHDLAWDKDSTLLAGALENGSIQFWDTSKLSTEGKVDAVAKGEKHTGAIKSLQFNPLQHNVLASGGSNGEIFIWDTKKLTNLAPFAPGSAITPMEVVQSVSWNNSVSHIFASSGSSGYTSIWDLKVKKEVLQLSYTSQTGSRATLSSVAWHPTQSTKLVTASETDGVPLILTWDLRNSNVPESILTGHKKGVLSVDWNSRDPSLLLSSGKDNTTILWNPLTAEKLAQYPTTSNWAFKTRFAPSTPDYFATASLDKKIVIQSLQDTSPPVANRIKSTSETDFWNKISDTDTQQPEFFVKQAPNWYGRPSSVNFGFGGKIIKLSKTGDKSSQIVIEKAQLPGSRENNELKTALDSKDFAKIVESRIKESFEGVNKADWELLENLKDETNVFEKFIALNIGEDESEEKSSNGDDFFNNLKEQPKKFTPSGEFKLTQNDLTDALLTKNYAKAVDISLKEDKLVEALVVALNGPEELKQKVLNYYLSKNGTKDSVARLLFSVSSNNVSDLVENADVSNWREIGNAINTYASSNQEVYRTYFNRLGDRVLKADPVANRNDAILNYISASSLDKVANIWVEELKSLEDQILKSKQTSSYDAHFDSLTEFVEKFSAYRSVLKLDAPIKDSESPLLSTILEYTTIISNSGQFELASKFLELLSDDIPTVKLEKERIQKASGLPAVSATAKTNSYAATRNVSSRYGNPVAQTPLPPVPTATTVPAAGHTRGRPSVSSNPYLPQQTAPVAQPPVSSYGPPQPSAIGQQSANLYGQPPLPQTSSNQYKPSAPQVVNPYKPVVSAQTPESISLPPPPKNGKKHETDGWNDLPSHFHKPTPSARSTPASAVYSNPTSAFPQQSSAPLRPTSRNASFHSQPAIPPPPRAVSKTRKQSTPSLSEPTVAAVSPPVNPRYTPVASASPHAPYGALNNNGGVGAPPINPSQAPPKNPYAISPQQQQTNAYAPPPHAQQGPPPQPFSPLAAPGPSSTPKNPYAPTAYPQQNSSGPIAPPTRGPITAASSLEQQQLPVQQSQYGVPPPPQGNYGIPPPPQNNYGSVPPPPQNNYGSVPPPPQNFQNSTPSAPPQQPQAPAEPVKAKYPSGDRSHIPADQVAIYEFLNSTFQEIKPKIPERFGKQIVDTEKRLNILFDHLNNEDLLTPASLSILNVLVENLRSGDYGSALAQHLELATNHTHEGGHWLVGVKRMIQFAEAVN